MKKTILNRIIGKKTTKYVNFIYENCNYDRSCFLPESSDQTTVILVPHHNLGDIIPFISVERSQIIKKIKGRIFLFVLIFL
jgi:hypothetical protein